MNARLALCAALVPLAAAPRPVSAEDPAAVRVVPAGVQRPVAERPAGEGTVEVLRADGTSERRPIGTLGAAGSATLEGVAYRFWFDGARRAAPDANRAQRVEVTLVGGDGLAGRLLDGGGDELLVELVGGVPYSISIDSIEALRFPARIPDDWTSPIVAADEGDRLYRRQGQALDRLDGTLEELTSEGVRFHGVIGSRVLPWGEVAALFVEPLGDAPDAAAAEGQPVVCDLVDLSRLRGRLIRLGATGLALRAGPDATPLELSLDAVATLAIDDGSVAFLSQLAPSRVEEGSPFGAELGMRWPHRVARAVDGAPLTAGGRARARGLGVHAPSTLAWTLDGGWARLIGGAVAIDDQVLRLGARGSVTFRVLVDGKEAWKSGVVRGGDGPLELPPIPLAGARELVLVVEQADETFVADRADWLGLLLVRAK
jgi:hypothetical protein